MRKHIRKIFYVAERDFIATVSTRGFIIAVLVPPAIYALIIFAFPRLINNRAPRVTGEVIVIDQTAQVFRGVQHYLSPQAIAERRNQAARRALASTPFAGPASAPMARSFEANIQQVPHFDVVRKSSDAFAQEKNLLRQRQTDRLAVIVIHPDAVAPAAGTDRFGTYDLFVRPNLDDRILNEIRRSVGDAVVDARMRAEGLDRRRVNALTDLGTVRSITVTEANEAETMPAFARMLPVGFGVLLMISVMTSGQYLLTTTIEEKSSRTMEVILSAVSPLQLMAGKILAQMGVGLVILVLYSSIGIAALFSMAMLGLLDFSLLFYLLIFFLITYVVIGSMMAAVGSAVNELREAQSLMMPITMATMLPWLFWYPITRDPNSLFSTVLSFVPPMNMFAMLLRLTSTTPPPLWQVWLSIACGLAAACAALWFASRVFKIGLLMHGRPPNFATLVRWARQA